MAVNAQSLPTLLSSSHYLQPNISSPTSLCAEESDVYGRRRFYRVYTSQWYHPAPPPSLTGMQGKPPTPQLSLPTTGNRPHSVPRDLVAFFYPWRSFSVHHTIPLTPPGASLTQVNHHLRVNTWSYRVGLGGTRKYNSSVSDVYRLI
jgi:hypothetical protein